MGLCVIVLWPGVSFLLTIACGLSVTMRFRSHRVLRYARLLLLAHMTCAGKAASEMSSIYIAVQISSDSPAPTCI